MSRKKTLVSIALIAAALAASFALLSLIYPSGDRSAGIPNIIHAIKHGKVSANAPSDTFDRDPFSDQIVAQLVKYYGDTITEKSTQAALLGIRDLVVGTHPEKGRTYFYGILKRAFPRHADEIMDTLDRLDQYNQWLIGSRERLIKMTAIERLTAMWQKRHELFGEDAEKIWTGELLATEERKAKVQDTLAELNESKDMTIDEKLDIYEGTLREVYARTPEAFLLNQRGLLAKVFFSIDSVQEELKWLTPEQRQQEINRIRSSMGFAPEQIEKMAQRDAYNAGRWETGMKYMEEREAVIQQYKGQEQEERLDELRQQYFHDEANTIALEEKDDFFRFNRPHIYGRN